MFMKIKRSTKWSDLLYGDLGIGKYKENQKQPMLWHIPVIPITGYSVN